MRSVLTGWRWPKDNINICVFRCVNMYILMYVHSTCLLSISYNSYLASYMKPIGTEFFDF